MVYDQAAASALCNALDPHLDDTTIYERRRGLDEFSVFSDAKMLARLIVGLSSILNTEFSDVRIIAALGPSGMPLAASLAMAPSVNVERWVYVADPAVSPVSRKYAPVLPKSVPKNGDRDGDYLRGQKVVMIDSVIKTGLTAIESAHKLREKNVDLQGMVTILHYPDFKDGEHLVEEFDFAFNALFTCRPSAEPPIQPAWFQRSTESRQAPSA